MWCRFVTGTGLRPAKTCNQCARRSAPVENRRHHDPAPKKEDLMKRLLLPVGLILGCTCIAAPAAAQARPSRPTVSPYLNLRRIDAPAAVNYYNLVRPQFEFRGAIQQLEQGVQSNRQNLNELGNEGPSATGHAFGFQNHLGYFQNTGGGGRTGSRGPVGSGPAVRPPAARTTVTTPAVGR
jgi:hypothetical protein